MKDPYTAFLPDEPEDDGFPPPDIGPVERSAEEQAALGEFMEAYFKRSARAKAYRAANLEKCVARERAAFAKRRATKTHYWCLLPKPQIPKKTCAPATGTHSPKIMPTPAKPEERTEPLKPMRQSLGDLLSRKLPPPVSRIWPWLDSGESCLLWGGTGTGKSMVAMTLALGVAGGGEALGWRFPKPCPVLYVDGEQSGRDLQTRFSLLGSTLKGYCGQTAAKNLIIQARTSSPAGGSFFDLNDSAQAEPFIADLKKAEIGFVVFDNLSTLADTVKDENSAAEFKNMQALFAHLKAADIASILVHHSGKAVNAKTYRGSSNIGTTFERILGLTHNEREPPTVLAACAEIQKYRSKPPPGFEPQVHFRLATTETPEGEPLSAVWQIDKEQGQLVEGWRMFSRGEHETVAMFIDAFNARFGTTKKASNFAREFSRPWCLKLGIELTAVDEVKRLMRSSTSEAPTSSF